METAPDLRDPKLSVRKFVEYLSRLRESVVRFIRAGRYRFVRFAVASCAFFGSLLLYVYTVRLLLDNKWACNQYGCIQPGDLNLQVWVPLAIAAFVASLAFSFGENLLSLRDLRRLLPKPPWIVALVFFLILLYNAMQRILRLPIPGDYLDLLFLIAGVGNLVGLLLLLIAWMVPSIAFSAQRAGVLVGRLMGTAALPLMVVGATFILSIYSSGVWIAMRNVPWLTVGAMWATFVVAAIGLGGSGRSERRRRARYSRVGFGRPTRLRARKSRMWHIPAILSLTSLLGFLVIAINLVDPDSASKMVGVTLDSSQYVSLLAKSGVLLSGLITLVSMESMNRNAASQIKESAVRQIFPLRRRVSSRRVMPRRRRTNRVANGRSGFSRLGSSQQAR